MIIFVHIGDAHHGLDNGLLAPGVELTYQSKEKRTLIQTDWSKWVWEDVYLPGIEKAVAFAGSSPLFVADSGDIVHGSRDQEHWYSPDPDHQVAIAERSLSEWRKAPTLAGFVLTFGTDRHDWAHGSSTRQIAADIAAWGFPVVCSDHHAIIQDGVLVDVAHHGPPTGDGQNYGGAARLYCQKRVRAALERGERYPNVVMRGHVHRDFAELVATRWGANGHYETFMSINPPMCGPNSFARKASGSIDRVRCGMTFIAVDDGRVIGYETHLVERDTRQYYTFPDGTQAHPYRGTSRKGSAADKMRAWWRRRKAGSAV